MAARYRNRPLRARLGWHHRLAVACCLVLLAAVNSAARPSPRFPRALIGKNKTALAAARAEVARGLGRADSSAMEVMRRYTKRVDQLIGRLDRQIVRELGAPPIDPATGRPTAYTLVAAGSYSRRELAPYSDIDHAILTQNASPAARQYFKAYAGRLDQLLVSIDGPDRHHLCELINPSGRLGDLLVGTPQQLARRLAGRSTKVAALPHRDRDYLQSCLSWTRPVLSRGGGQLYRSFSRQVQKELGDPAPALRFTDPRAILVSRLLPSLREPFGIPRAATRWQQDQNIAMHVPLDPDEAIARGKVNIKHDILKAIQAPIFVLRTLYNINRTDTVGVLGELKRRGRMDPNLADRLAQTYEAASRIRLKNHLKHGRSHDRLGPLAPDQQSAIRKMVQPLHQLNTAVERLLHEDPNSFVVRANQQSLDLAARKYTSRLNQAHERVRPDLRAMMRLFRLSPRNAATRTLVSQIAGDLEGSLSTIARRIDSARRQRTLHSTSVKLGGGRTVDVLSTRIRPRIGFFPVAANPVTRGHLILALRAVARGELDHVVVVPGGEDARKPVLATNQALRHTLVKRAVAGLPCLSYSPIARGTALSGETNFSRWIAINGDAFHGVYIAGGDHNHYVKDGRLDTLGKISRAHGGGGPLRGRDTSVLLFERAGYATGPVRPPAGMQPVEVTYLPDNSFTSSATALRRALASAAGDPQPELMLLPWRSARTLVRLAGGTASSLVAKKRASVPRHPHGPAQQLLPLAGTSR